MLFIYTYIIQLKCGVQTKKRNEINDVQFNLKNDFLFKIKEKKNLRKV